MYSYLKLHSFDAFGNYTLPIFFMPEFTNTDLAIGNLMLTFLIRHLHVTIYQSTCSFPSQLPDIGQYSFFHVQSRNFRLLPTTFPGQSQGTQPL